MAAATVTRLHPTKSAIANDRHADVIQTVLVSPSLMVLKVKPRAEFFKKNRVAAAQKAGFSWAPAHVGISILALLDRDLGEPLATMKIHGGADAVGQLSCIEFHIDPEQCPIEWQAGTRLVEACAQFADLMEGRLCDGHGDELSDDAKKSLAKHIDDVMCRRERERNKARIVTLPSGERRKLLDLSFMHVVLRESGARKGAYRHVNFDVQPMPYYEGHIKGIEMAREMLDFFKSHRRSRPSLSSVLSEMFERMESANGSLSKPEVANVASGFMDALTEIVIGGARHLNYESCLDAMIERNKKDAEFWQRHLEEEKAKLCERMRAVRAAKTKKVA